MKEDLAGRLELAGARARAILGSVAFHGRTESSGAGTGGEPGEDDAERIAARMRFEAGTDSEVALASARELVEQARNALRKIVEGVKGADLSETEAVALESVIHVRGRPPIRVLGDHLESLEHYPGSELWQDFIADFEDRITAAASVTGGIFVDAFETGNPRWLQGSAWLIAPNRVVTNRHVLLPSNGEKLIKENGNELNATVREDFKIDIEFAADDRVPAAKVTRRVINVLYVAKPGDAVDVAVLAIEPYDSKPLLLAEAAIVPPKNLYVVGHPGLVESVPDEVKAVFGNPDGKKRVSFGQLLGVLECGDTMVHDASTVGGYSGGPVMGISNGLVVGLHYYGDPATGNLAVTAHALRKHGVYQYLT